MNETRDGSHRLVTFGVFELDFRSGELRKSGARVTLQQQPLQLLSVLLERPGELVTREELRKRLWPDDTFVDFDHGVSAAVKRLRQALGDSAESPRFVETVPRRGYRFIAPVNGIAGSAALEEHVGERVRVRWGWIIVAVTMVAVLALGIAAWLKPVPRVAAGAPTDGAPGPVLQLTTGSHLNTEPAISPDGEWIAYASDRSGEGHLDLWGQRLKGGEPVRLTNDAADDREPSFSSDGSRIAFRSERDGGGIYVIPAHSGGDAKLLVRGGAHGARFSPDGRWLAYSTGPGRFGTDKTSGLFSQTYLVPASGGESTRLLPDFASVSWPVWSPDGRRVLVTARRGSQDFPEWWVVTPGGGGPVKVEADMGSGMSRFPVRAWSWLKGDRILFSAAFGGDSWDLWEVPITPGVPTAPAKPRRLTTGTGLQAHASIVGDRLLVFSSLTQTVNIWSVPLRANSGRVIGPPQRVTATSRLQWWPSVSVDGKRLVFRGGRLGSGGIWLRELDAAREMLLVPSSAAAAPLITADGSRVGYTSFAEGGTIYTVSPLNGVAEKICGDCGPGWVYLDAWSRDGTRLLYQNGNPSVVFEFDLRSGKKRPVLQRAPNDLYQARFSPDDKWIAVLEPFYSEGSSRLWIVPFHDGSAPSPDDWIPLTGGQFWDDKPRWSPDGNLMYFTSLRDGFLCLWAQRLKPDTKHPIGPPFPVQHFHDSRLSLTNTGFAILEVALARDKVFINLGELAGNIWTTSLR